MCIPDSASLGLYPGAFLHMCTLILIIIIIIIVMPLQVQAYLAVCISFLVSRFFYKLSQVDGEVYILYGAV